MPNHATIRDGLKAGPAPRQGRSVASRVVSILWTFDPDHPRQSLTEISRRVGQPLSTVHRIVADLVELQVLVRDDDGLYRIGLRIWELGELNCGDLLDAAAPCLGDLYIETRENVHLAVRDGRDAV